MKQRKRNAVAPGSDPVREQLEMNYQEALTCRFLLDQTIYTVGECPDAVFKRLIEECGQLAYKCKRWNPTQQKKLLHLLDCDCSDLARWYALDLLLARKVQIPLQRGKSHLH